MNHTSTTKKKSTSGKTTPRTRSQPARHPLRHSSKAPRAGQTQQDALALLRDDHKKLRRVLGELKSATEPSQRERLLAKVKRELQAHTKIEEEIFYPAFREAAKTKKDLQLFYEATAEHDVADLILKEIESANDATQQFPGHAKVLKEVVEHHAGEEESDMFPRARELLTAAELRDLGQQMVDRKRDLLRTYEGGSTLQRVADFVRLPFCSQRRS